ncbi:MAG: KH domain-containing protein [Bacilli bacterium]|nr:KH domain-containing protein [Bacilli bacterium]
MLVDVVEFLVKNLVTEPDMVSVKEFEDDDMITLEIMVSNDDMGKVIGKDGKVASALRTVVKAVAYKKTNKKININIDSF